MSAEALLIELRKNYIANLPSLLDEIESLVIDIENSNGKNRASIEELHRQIHSMKGSGGTYGYTIISSICHQFEDFLLASFPDGVAPREAITVTISYIDLIRKTITLIENNTINFSPVLKELEAIKKCESAHELNGIFIGQEKHLHTQMCKQILDNINIKYASIDNGITALQRLIHEHFDFLITSKENLDISGPALIAAHKLNFSKNRNIKTILITTDSLSDNDEKLTPDYIVLKNKDFSINLQKALESIKNELASNTSA